MRQLNLNQSELRGELRHNESLAAYTTWRVGGPARTFYRPVDLDDLELFLRGLPEREAVFWLGLGSNLLVRDGGFAGTVIATSGALGGLSLERESVIRSGAGVTCNKVARFSVKNRLSGAEFLVGIPGTLGGALAMNAGAWGGETWALVESVVTIDRRGQRRTRQRDDFAVGYRQVEMPAGEWFVEAILALTAGDSSEEQGLERIKELLAERAQSQPTGVASAGSVFRNPSEQAAGRLIEASGLKGRCYGGACVSGQHGNFIINTGDASAADIEALIEEVAETVRKDHGVSLIPEVRIIGEAA